MGDVIRGDGESVWQAEITEITSELRCAYCDLPVLFGETVQRHINTDAVYHEPCLDFVALTNPATPLLCKPRKITR